MAIEKKLIHFGKLADFNTQLNAGNILDRSIVFIQDAKKIWTHGTFYDCSGSGAASSDVYVTDFTVADLQMLSMDGGSIQSNVSNLIDAINAGKEIRIHVGAGEGYAPCVAYVDDMVYIDIFFSSRENISVEIPASSEIDEILSEYITIVDLRTQSDWNETDNFSDAYIKNKPTIPTKTSQLENDSEFVSSYSYEDLPTVVNAPAFDDDTYIYAFPTSSTGDEDDVIATKNTLKTINGESILGEGDLTVEGGVKVYTWNWDGSDSGTLTQEEMNAIAAADAIQIIRTDEFALTTTVLPIAFSNYICIVDVLSITNEISKRVFSFNPNSLTWETILGDSTDAFNVTIVGENEDGSIQGAEGTFSHIYTNDIHKIAINGIFFSIMYLSPQYAIAVSDNYMFGYESGVTGWGYNVIRITSDDVLSIQDSITFASSSDIPTKTSHLENDSNFVSSDGLKTINGESIVGSGNIEISGGASGTYEKEVIIVTGDTSLTLQPNKLYSIELSTTGNDAEVGIFFDEDIDDTICNEYNFILCVDADFIISLPDDIIWANGEAPQFNPSKAYHISIVDHYAVFAEFNEIY